MRFLRLLLAGVLVLFCLVFLSRLPGNWHHVADPKWPYKVFADLLLTVAFLFAAWALVRGGRAPAARSTDAPAA